MKLLTQEGKEAKTDMKHFYSAKVIYLTVAFIFLAAAALYIFPVKHKISPINTLLTKERLRADLKILGGRDLDVKYFEIYFNGTFEEETIKSEDGSINRSTRIISITTSNKKLWAKITKPYDVNQAMRTWLYLKDRKLPYEVVGVYSVFNVKWIMAKAQRVLISKTEFEELYKEVYKPDLSEEQLIAQLSELWILKTNYQKWWEDE